MVLVILLGLCSALHFNLSLLQKHLTDYTKKRRFLIFLLHLGTNKNKGKKEIRRRRQFWTRPRHFPIGPSKVSDRFVRWFLFFRRRHVGLLMNTQVTANNTVSKNLKSCNRNGIVWTEHQNGMKLYRYCMNRFIPWYFDTGAVSYRYHVNGVL